MLINKGVRTAIVISLIALLGVLPACSKKGGGKKTFVYCSEGSPSSFNPQLVTDGPSFNASSRNIYNRLVEFERGQTTIIPALAKTWDISKDGLKYTFHLRRGVKWHKTKWFTPKRDFNADDVIFTFNRQRLKSHPFHETGGGTYEYFDSMDMGKILKNISKTDDYTVIFELSKPEAPFLANLAMDFASILSKEYGDQLIQQDKKDNMDTTPVGTGPFVFKKYLKDTQIRYSAHPDFFRGKSPLDELVFVITPDASVRYQKLKTGECHLIAYPNPADLKAMELNSKIEVVKQPGLNVGYLAMNVEKPPFDNPLVRQAVNHALNRAKYIEAIYLGNAMVAKNPIPPTMWSYNEATVDFAFDPEKSKALLRKAGYDEGFETELWTLPVSRPYNPNGRKMGEMMQADLKAVGIKAKLITYDWPTYLTKSKKGEHAMLQLGWTGDNGDPDNFLNVLLSCTAGKAGANRARWCDLEFDRLINEAKATTDRSERTVLYKKAQEVFKNAAPWVTIAHSMVYKAMSKNVMNYVMDPLGGEAIYGLDLK